MAAIVICSRVARRIPALFAPSGGAGERRRAHRQLALGRAIQSKEIMTRIAWFALSLLVPTVGCSRTKAASATVAGLGEVMSQVGHRFEMAGRAAKANRFEMAAFEVGELEELSRPKRSSRFGDGPAEPPRV
jgi:hypothetical protein